MADPDLELSGGRGKGEGGPCFVLLALPAFLPSVISSIFTTPPPEKNRGGTPGSLSPSSPRSANKNVLSSSVFSLAVLKSLN